jgi:hypothetical protein
MSRMVRSTLSSARPTCCGLVSSGASALAVALGLPVGRVLAILLCTCALIPEASRAQGLVGEWKLLAGPVDPPSMVGHAAVHDAARHRMVVVNGLNPRELWVLSLPATGSPTWSRVDVQGSEFPPPRSLFAAVLDTANDRVIVFGGMLTYETAGNDVWSLSLADPPHWEQLHPSGAPPALRAEPAAVFDPVRRRVVLFGGGIDSDYAPRVFFSDTWSLDLEPEPHWTLLSPPGAAPGARKAAAAVRDPLTDRMILFGGYTPNQYGNRSGYDDTWALSLSGDAKWEKLPVTATPGIREEALAVLEPLARRIVLTGGNGACAGGATDTWTLPLDPAPPGAPLAWSQMATTGENPPNALQAGIFSPERGSLIQFGGQHGWSESDELNLATGEWRQINSEAPISFPSRRSQPALLPDQKNGGFLLFGGLRAGCQQDLWRFADGQTAPWVHLPTEDSAPGCQSYQFVHDVARDRLLCVDAGYFNYWPTNDFVVWELPLHGARAWSKLVDSGPKPPGRTWFSVAFDTRRNRLLMSGGETFHGHEYYGEFQDDLWAYSLDDHSWSELLPVNSPGVHQAHWMGYDARNDQLLLSGGGDPRYGDDAAKQFDCWRLPLGADSLQWHRLPDAPTWQPLAIDSLRNRLLAWNGRQSVATLSLDEPVSWKPLALTGQSPTPRINFSLTYDLQDDRVIAYGGQDGDLNFMGDVEAIRFSRPISVELLGQGPLDRTWDRKHAGWVELAVLGEPGAPVDAIQVSTATLGGAHVAMVGGRPWVQRRDANHDRIPDLLLRFPVDSVKAGPSVRALWFVAATTGLDVRAVVHLEGRRSSTRDDIAQSVDPSPILGVFVTNPSRTSLAFRLMLPTAAPAELDMFDVAGRRVVHRDLSDVQAGEQRLEMPRGDLAAGFYLVRVRQGDASAVARSIILD